MLELEEASGTEFCVCCDNEVDWDDVSWCTVCGNPMCSGCSTSNSSVCGEPDCYGGDYAINTQENTKD